MTKGGGRSTRGRRWTRHANDDMVTMHRLATPEVPEVGIDDILILTMHDSTGDHVTVRPVAASASWSFAPDGDHHSHEVEGVRVYDGPSGRMYPVHALARTEMTDD